MQLHSALFSTNSKNKKHPFSKAFLYIRKMELSTKSDIKFSFYISGNGSPNKFLIFSRKKIVLIFQKIETLKKSLYFRKRNLLIF